MLTRLVEPYVEAMVSSIGNWLLHSYHLFVTAALDEEDVPEEVDVDLEGSSADFLSLVTQVLSFVTESLSEQLFTLCGSLFSLDSLLGGIIPLYLS